MRRLLRQPGPQPGRRQRPAELESLKEITTLFPETIGLGLGLDALGDDSQVQGMSHLDHGPYQDRRTRVVVRVADKGAVDLEHVDRQLVELAERGGSHAEIIDGDPDALCPQSP
jgi:hypothetical protein